MRNGVTSFYGKVELFLHFKREPVRLISWKVKQVICLIQLFLIHFNNLVFLFDLGEIIPLQNFFGKI